MPNWKKVIVSGSDAALNSLNVTNDLELTGSLNHSGSYNLDGNIYSEGYHQFIPIQNSIDPSISGSYIYATGSNNDLYLTQNYNGLSNNVRLRWLEDNLHTGMLWGGVVSGSVGGTTFNVTAGEGIIVSLNASTGSEGPNPIVEKVEWDDYTNITPTYLNTNDFTWLLIDSDGDLIQQTTAPTEAQFANNIQVGVLVHPNQTNISIFRTFTQPSYGSIKQIFQFIRTFGGIKVSGHVIGDNGANLQLSRTSGRAYAIGRNYEFDADDPSLMNDPSSLGPSIFYYYKESGDWVTTTGTNVVNPNQYNEDGDGLSSVGTNNWTIQKVFFFPKAPDVLGVYYGRQTYPNLVDARDNLQFEEFEENENTRNQAIFLGYVVVKQGATNLSLQTQARFLQAGAFRTMGIGGGGSAPVVTNLEDLNDVAISTISTGDLLTWAGAEWQNSKTLDGDYIIDGDLTVTTSITGSGLQLNSLPSQASEATSLMIGASGNVGTRELGSNAFNSTAFTTCTGTVTGTGANNQVATWNGTTSLDGSSNFTYDGTTLDLTYTGTGDLLRLTSTDAGASSAPDLTFCRNSVSPADNDTLGTAQFWGKSTTANKLYAAIYGRIACATSGQTKGNISFKQECDNVFIDTANFSPHGLYVLPPSFNSMTTPGIGLTVTGGVSGSTTLQIGSGHTNTGTLSSIAGGDLNSILDDYSFIGGGCNNKTGENSHITIVGGKSNVACADYTFIGGGRLNGIDDVASDSSIVGGSTNCISGDASGMFIGGGTSNRITGEYIEHTFIGGGKDNFIDGDASNENSYSVIVGGRCNKTGGACSFIGGGAYNFSSGIGSTIAGGTLNTASAACTGILGGESNYVNHTKSFIVGSDLTSTATCYTFMNNACVEGTTRTTTLVETSAKRFKECILPLQDQIENIKKLEPVEFQWKKDKTKDIGFIAEDVKEIYPDLVAYEQDGEISGVQYSKLTTVLVKALQQQQEQIEKLKKEIFIIKQQG